MALRSAYAEWPLTIALNRPIPCGTLRDLPIEHRMSAWVDVPPQADLIVCAEPLVAAPQVETARPFIETLLLQTRWLVVNVLAKELLPSIPEHCILLYRPSIWAANIPLQFLRGRPVWIARGHPKDQWRAFLDLLVAGVYPVGVTLNVTRKVWSYSFTPISNDGTICTGTQSLVQAWRRRVAEICAPYVGT